MHWLLWFLFPLFLHGAEPQGVVGWIVKCQGDWRDENARPATIECSTPQGKPTPVGKLWHPVTVDSKLTRAKKVRGDFVVFKAAQTGQSYSLNCDEPKNCEPYPPIKLYVPQTWNPILAAFSRNIEKSYAQIRLMQSRSSDTRGRDSIVAEYAVAEQGDVPTKKLLRDNAPAGEYVLETCQFDAEKGCPGEPKSQKIRWEPTQPDARWPEPLSAGLYEIVRVLDAGGISMRTKDRGLLLVAPRSADGKAFKELRAKIESAEKTFLTDWTDKNEGREMLSAFFLYLSGQIQK